MSRVVISGGNGFLGTHVVGRFKQEGYDVAVLDYPNKRNVGKTIDIICDISKLQDSASYSSLVSQLKGADYLVSLAAEVSIPLSIKDPGLFMKTNTMGTFYLLQAAKEANIKLFLHTSTSEVYGTAQYTPIDEKHPLCPQSPYAASKLAADKIAESFYRSYGFPVIIMRPFNMTGPGQSDRALIPTLISQVLTKDVINVGRLDTKRDYTLAEDTAELYVKVLKKNDLSMCGEVFNIGTGISYSGLQILYKICELTDKSPKIVIDKNRMRSHTSEVEILQCSSAKLNKSLFGEGYHYEYASIDETLKQTIEYIKQHPENYSPNKYNI